MLLVIPILNRFWNLLRLWLEGSSGLLADLDTALITVNVEQAKDNLVLNPPVTLLTKKGEIVSGQFEISPQNIQVFVPITENTDSKTVAIKPNIKGGPAEGFRVARVILDPETVRITGSYEALSQIYQVNTAPQLILQALKKAILRKWL